MTRLAPTILGVTMAVASLPRAAAWLGVAAAALGFLVALWAVVSKIAGIYSPRGWFSLMAVVLFIGGVQLLMLGVIGEYLSRVYDEVRQRPLYVVSYSVGLEERAQSAEVKR